MLTSVQVGIATLATMTVMALSAVGFAYNDYHSRNIQIEAIKAESKEQIRLAEQKLQLSNASAQAYKATSEGYQKQLAQTKIDSDNNLKKQQLRTKGLALLEQKRAQDQINYVREHAESTLEQRLQEARESQEKAINDTIERITSSDAYVFGKYLTNDMLADWKDNESRLRKADEHPSQVRSNVNLRNPIIIQAAKYGNINFTIYNIALPEDTPVNCGAQDLQQYIKTAFHGLDIDISINAVHIDMQQHMKDRGWTNAQIARFQDEWSERVTNTSLANISTNGFYSELSGSRKRVHYDNFFADILGDKFVEYRTPGENSGTDLSIVSANFTRSSTVGVSLLKYFNPRPFVLINSNSSSNCNDYADTIAHEGGHGIGLPHDIFPLSGMSYSYEGTELVLSYPNFFFGPSSVIAWENTRERVLAK